MSETLEKAKAAMNISNFFGFLKILKEAIKIISRNGKMMASVTLLLSLLLPSILFLQLVHFQKFLTKKVDRAIEDSQWSDSDYTPNQIIAFNLALLLLAGIAFVVTTAVISSLSLTTTILLSAASYTGEEASPPHLVAAIRKKWSSQRRSISQTGRVVLVTALTVYLVTLYDDAIALSVVVLIGTAAFVVALYGLVVGWLAVVVAVLEGSEAAESKARELVVGHRLHGFVINLLVNLPIWIGFLGYSMVEDDEEWYLNIDSLAIKGLLFFNVFSLAKMFVAVVYTVLYFECKRYHGQEVFKRMMGGEDEESAVEIRVLIKDKVAGLEEEGDRLT